MFVIPYDWASSLFVLQIGYSSHCGVYPYLVFLSDWPFSLETDLFASSYTASPLSLASPSDCWRVYGVYLQIWFTSVLHFCITIFSIVDRDRAYI